MRATRISSLVLIIAGIVVLSSGERSIVVARGIGGDPIPIANAGFEANPVPTNCFAGLTPTGWTLYDPTGIFDGAVDAIGALNTQPGGPHFIDGAPEGDHVALVFLQGNIGRGPMGLVQTLGANLETDTIYTLTAQVGNIASGQGPPPCDVFGFFDLDGFPGYQVQLLAGGVVIAQDNNTLTGTIPDGHWGVSTVQIAIGPTHPQAGQPLAVRLINLNQIDTPMDPGIEVDFDDVRLIRGCPAIGDLDASGGADLPDVPLFVDVLLGQDTDPLHVAQADLNCSQAADGADIALFIQALLN